MSACCLPGSRRNEHPFPSPPLMTVSEQMWWQLCGQALPGRNLVTCGHYVTRLLVISGCHGPRRTLSTPGEGGASTLSGVVSLLCESQGTRVFCLLRPPLALALTYQHPLPAGGPCFPIFTSLLLEPTHPGKVQPQVQGS